MSRSDLREVKNTTTPFFVLLHKEVLLSTNDLPSSLPSVVLDLLQDFEDGCTVYAERTIGLETILDAPDGTPR